MCPRRGAHMRDPDRVGFRIRRSGRTVQRSTCEGKPVYEGPCASGLTPGHGGTVRGPTRKGKSAYEGPCAVGSSIRHQGQRCSGPPGRGSRCATTLAVGSSGSIAPFFTDCFLDCVHILTIWASDPLFRSLDQYMRLQRSQNMLSIHMPGRRAS